MRQIYVKSLQQTLQHALQHAHTHTCCKAAAHANQTGDCNTHCNRYCNTHGTSYTHTQARDCNTPCNTYCNTLQRELQHTRHLADIHLFRRGGAHKSLNQAILHMLMEFVRHCNTLQHTTTHYSTESPGRHPAHINGVRESLQHTTSHCNTPQHTATHYTTACIDQAIQRISRCALLYCGAVCCSVRQCVALCSRVLRAQSTHAANIKVSPHSS